MTDFDKAYKIICELVAKYEKGKQHYLSQSYSEAAVRQDFIDNFFTALGWDVGHKYQHNPYEQEVKIEQGVKISGAQKRADYSFAIAPNFRDAKFFAEAKKPANSLKNAQDYFQSIRYGWHKSHPVSILTNFDEFHILDCRFTPDINDSLNKSITRFHYTDYLNKEKFSEIYYLFSRESVADNSIEKNIVKLPKRIGKATQKTLFPYETYQIIDDVFLELIDDIRLKLARTFKKQNENLTSEQLTEYTQKTIDRLVFIRFLEDKLIEQEHYVSEFGDGISAWGDFIYRCKKLDAKYNGIVFKEHFIDRQTFTGAEEIVFRSICQDICHLNSRFLYNEIPVHILGSIYERFLGKIVYASANKVTVDEKPEVKKAGGVYYTPKYIVDFIIRNTIGKIIEGKTPEQISKLRFADISCGSGSFLIGVFDCLLDYHNRYYQKKPDKAKNDGCIQKDGLWILSIKQKQKILTNNIFGVDIDQQATEITQLSLALKMLEDETTATANEMQVFFHEKILPDMSKNIVCGNSLIGKHFKENDNFTKTEIRKLNAINFDEIFKGVMSGGGFDAIVGNPPYIGIKKQDSIIKEAIRSQFKFSIGADLYVAFLEKGLSLINKTGKLSYIVPNKFFGADYGKKIRAELKDKYFFENILDEKDNKVFKDAFISCIAITISRKAKELYTTIYRVNNSNEYKFTELFDTNNKIQIESNSEEKSIINKLVKNKKLMDSCVIRTGIMGFEYWKMNDIIKNKGTINSRHLRLYTNGNFNRYIDNWDEKINLYKKEYYSPTIELNEKYLNKNTINYFNKVGKILVRGVAQKIAAIIDEYGSGFLVAVHSIDSFVYDNRYIIALLNSKLFNWFHLKTIYSIRIPEGSLKYPVDFFKNLPIPDLDLKNKAQKKQYDVLVGLAEQMIESKKELKNAMTDKDKTYYEHQCYSLESAIDKEVYKLYNITDEEITIIESN